MFHIHVPFVCEGVDCSCLQCYKCRAYTCTHISQDGCTALHLAVHEGHEDVVELLLEAKADIDLKILRVKIECIMKYRYILLCLQYKMYLFMQTDLNLSPLITYIVNHD